MLQNKIKLTIVSPTQICDFGIAPLCEGHALSTKLQLFEFNKSQYPVHNSHYDFINGREFLQHVLYENT